MRKITVFRVDYVKRTRIPIGEVVERRSKFRPDNMAGLLLIARKTFSSNSQDAFQITIDNKLQYSDRGAAATDVS